MLSRDDIARRLTSEVVFAGGRWPGFSDTVDFPGATYVEHDGEAEILPGVRLLPAPGHSAGHQVLVVETSDGPVVLGGDVGYSSAELERGDTSGRQLVLELAAPTYLAHVAERRVPRLRA